MMRRFWAWPITLLTCTLSAWAQQPDVNEAAPSPPADTSESLSARQAVREGNLHLLEGDADAALEAYAHAKELRPGAPQIPFVQGLAELQRKDYDAARDLLRETAASDDAALAADAQYAVGASYHREALESENPEEAIEQLEAAMERYRNVLARRPDHALARESDYKAASMRRRLKQLLEQQQQQQQNQDGEEQEEQEDQDQQQSDSQEQQDGEQQQQDEQSQSEQQDGEDQQQKQSESEQEQSESEEQEQEAQASQQEEEVSREQAERRLREMMQSIRDKQKQRRQKARKIPLPPVEKDW